MHDLELFCFNFFPLILQHCYEQKSLEGFDAIQFPELKTMKEARENETQGKTFSPSKDIWKDILLLE